MSKGNTTVLFVASALFVAACMAYVYVFLTASRAEVRRLNDWVEQSKIVITQAHEIMTLHESMLSEQRGFFITGDKKFSIHFHDKQNRFKKATENLVNLTNDNTEQNRRSDEIRDFAEEYTAYLTKRKEEYNDIYLVHNSSKIEEFIKGAQTVEILHDKLTRLINEFLNEENNLLKIRFALVNEKRGDYSRNMILSLLGACALILLINWVLFRTQRNFFLDSERLRNIDDRYKVAIAATNDGVFDWDINNKAIYLSSQIFKMCGHYKQDYDGSLLGLVTYLNGINPLELIHPDDLAMFRQNIQHFTDGLTSEYNNVFRVKHANGYWMWVQARGGGVFGVDGKPVRLIGSHSDISIQKKMEERLKKEMEEADLSSKSKMESLAHLSHEIRTPLTTVTGIAEILERQAAQLTEKHRILIKALVTSSSTLKDIINDVLDFSRIDSGEIKLEKNAIQMDALMREIVSIMSVQAIEKDIMFSADHQGLGHLIFEGDQIRLKQVLINLVGNAIKFTQQGSVKVVAAINSFNVKESKANLVISVTDTGIGISPKDHQIIFDKFKQVDDTISKGFGGTGLGLPISKSLVEMMGGELTVESELDKGSNFTVCIPINIINTEDFISGTGSERLASSIGSIPCSTASDDRRVLLVEDYEGNIVVIGCILEELGLGYDVARNGLEAIEMFTKKKYGAILMDLQMPKLDGLSTTIKIREFEKSNPQNTPTPIIGMTAHATYKDKNNCLESGMNEFISKPIDQAKLVGTLMQYINKN